MSDDNDRIGTATLVRRQRSGGGADQGLYLMDPPFESMDAWSEDPEETTRHRYVLASKAYVSWTGPETYLFAADRDGNVTDWAELSGSLRGDYTDEEVFDLSGYEVIVPTEEKEN